MEFGTVFECEAGEESGASRGGQGEGTDLRYGTTCPYEPPRPPLGLVRVQSRLPAIHQGKQALSGNAQCLFLEQYGKGTAIHLDKRAGADSTGQ